MPLKSNPPLINSVCRVATLRMAEDKVKDELYEMSKPLARYADDEDLERMLKERERDGDPMLKFIKKKPKLTPTGKPKKGIYLMSLFLPPFSQPSLFLLPLLKHLLFSTSPPPQRGPHSRDLFLQTGLEFGPAIAGMGWQGPMDLRRHGSRVRVTKWPLKMWPINGV